MVQERDRELVRMSGLKEVRKYSRYQLVITVDESTNNITDAYKSQFQSLPTTINIGCHAIFISETYYCLMKS